MQLSRHFEQMCQFFYPGSDEGCATVEEWIAVALGGLGRRQKNGMISDLEELLTDRFSDRDLERIWREAAPSFQFSLGYHRDFFHKILNFLRESKGAR